MFLPLRDDTPQLRFPTATAALVAANVLVFLYECTLLPADVIQLARRAGVVPWEIRHLHDLVDAVQPRDLVPPPLTIYTAMFIHGDWLHLLGNVWVLWLFGSKLEGLWGTARYVLLYAVAGTVAAALQVAAAPESVMPMIGASGAIAGILGAYAAAFPRARVRCLLFVVFFITWVTLPAPVLLGLWFLGQFAAAGGQHPGVAWFAHIGGFLTGYSLARAVIRPVLPAAVRVVRT